MWSFRVCKYVCDVFCVCKYLCGVFACVNIWLTCSMYVNICMALLRVQISIWHFHVCKYLSDRFNCKKIFGCHTYRSEVICIQQCQHYTRAKIWHVHVFYTAPVAIVVMHNITGLHLAHNDVTQFQRHVGANNDGFINFECPCIHERLSLNSNVKPDLNPYKTTEHVYILNKNSNNILKTFTVNLSPKPFTSANSFKEHL